MSLSCVSLSDSTHSVCPMYRRDSTVASRSMYCQHGPTARVLPGMSGELCMSTPMITRLTFWQNHSLLVRSERVLLPGYFTISSEPDAQDHRWMCGLGISSEPPVFFLDVFFWTFYVLCLAVGGYKINHWIDWEEVTTTVNLPEWTNKLSMHSSTTKPCMNYLWGVFG